MDFLQQLKNGWTVLSDPMTLTGRKDQSFDDQAFLSKYKSLPKSKRAAFRKAYFSKQPKNTDTYRQLNARETEFWKKNTPLIAQYELERENNSELSPKDAMQKVLSAPYNKHLVSKLNENDVGRLYQQFVSSDFRGKRQYDWLDAITGNHSRHPNRYALEAFGAGNTREQKDNALFAAGMNDKMNTWGNAASYYIPYYGTAKMVYDFTGRGAELLGAGDTAPYHYLFNIPQRYLPLTNGGQTFAKYTADNSYDENVRQEARKDEVENILGETALFIPNILKGGTKLAVNMARNPVKTSAAVKDAVTFGAKRGARHARTVVLHPLKSAESIWNASNTGRIFPTAANLVGRGMNIASPWFKYELGKSIYDNLSDLGKIKAVDPEYIEQLGRNYPIYAAQYDEARGEKLSNGLSVGEAIDLAENAQSKNDKFMLTPEEKILLHGGLYGSSLSPFFSDTENNNQRYISNPDNIAAVLDALGAGNGSLNEKDFAKLDKALNARFNAAKFKYTRTEMASDPYSGKPYVTASGRDAAISMANDDINRRAEELKEIQEANRTVSKDNGFTPVANPDPEPKPVSATGDTATQNEDTTNSVTKIDRPVEQSKPVADPPASDQNKNSTTHTSTTTTEIKKTTPGTPEYTDAWKSFYDFNYSDPMAWFKRAGFAAAGAATADLMGFGNLGKGVGAVAGWGLGSVADKLPGWWDKFIAAVNK